MKSEKLKSAATVIEIAAISILSLLLAVMFARYCFLKNASSVSAPVVSEHRFLQANETPTEDSDFAPPGILSPEFVGIVVDGKQFTPTTTEARETIMAEIYPFILAAFSDISMPAKFSTDSLKFDYIDNIIEQNPDYIHLSFPWELPAEGIVPFAGGYTLGDIYHAFNVKDLLIFCEDDGSISAISLDNDFNLTTLSVRNPSDLSFESLKTLYGNAGFEKFEYMLHNNKNFPVLNSSVAFQNISAYTDSGDFTENNDDGISKILDNFGFNPNSTSSYRTEGSEIFVDRLGELSISRDGSIVYSGDGIPLSQFFYNDDDAFSAEEIMLAARNIITSLDKQRFGGCADLSLRSVSTDGELLTFSFSYTVNGLSIDDAKNSAVLVFDSNSLVSANISAKNFVTLESTFTDIPQKLLFVFASQNLDTEGSSPIGFAPVYSLSDDGSFYNARFALILEEAENRPEKEEAYNR